MIVSGEERRGSGGGCGGCGGCCCGGRGRSYTVVTAGVVVAVVALMLTHSHHLARSHKTGYKNSIDRIKQKIRAPQYQYARVRYFEELWYTIPYNLQRHIKNCQESNNE